MALLAATASTVCWGGWLLIGLWVLHDIGTRDAPSFPNAGQAVVFAGVPLLMALVSMTCLWRVWSCPQETGKVLAIALAQVIAAGPFFVVYVGGI